MTACIFIAIWAIAVLVIASPIIKDCSHKKDKDGYDDWYGL